jgi:CRISPR-associated endonuclease Cas1
MHGVLNSTSEMAKSEAWADRCGYWLKAPVEKRGRGHPRRQASKPLILTGHGMRLRVDNGALVVRNGFTHYPQAVNECRYFRGDRNRPSRIIVVDGSGSVSFDVLAWLAEQAIPLVQIDWRGQVVTVLGSGCGSNPERVAAQLAAQRSGKALAVARSLIAVKIENSVETLLQALPGSTNRDHAVSKLRAEAAGLARRSPKSIRELLGAEGRVAYAYFNAWRSLPLRWKGLGRRPIPEDWHCVGQRQSLNTRKKGRNRFASHPVNAILNYAYAVLEAQVRMQIITEGYDPNIGYLHTSNPDRPALVFDLMEPLRPIVDRSVLQFVQSHTFHPADFTIRADGVCRLNPEMARQIVSLISRGEHQPLQTAGCLFVSRFLSYDGDKI